MMALKKGSLNAAQAETYYEEKYTVDDYYSEQQRVTGQWHGKLAAELGLSGEVNHEDFSALLQGIDPHTGKILVEKARGYDKHAAGWDGVFNAPKSVSIQALIGEDHRLIQAHRKAVDRALIEVEKYAMARQHGGREFIATGNIMAAAFTHVADGALDQELADSDLSSTVWRLRSAPDIVNDLLLVTIPAEQKDSSRIYVFFETGHPGHRQQKSEVYGPFIEAAISDNALLVNTVDEETSLELAKYQDGAGWWCRRHIEPEYPQVPGNNWAICRPFIDDPEEGDTGWYRVFIIGGPLKLPAGRK
jgi:TrwC relaxase